MLPYKDFNQKNKEVLIQLEEQREIYIQNRKKTSVLGSIVIIFLGAGEIGVSMLGGVLVAAWYFSWIAFSIVLAVIMVLLGAGAYACAKDRNKKKQLLALEKGLVPNNLIPILLKENGQKFRLEPSAKLDQKRFEAYALKNLFQRRLVNFQCHHSFSNSNPTDSKSKWHFLEFEISNFYHSDYMVFEFPIALGTKGYTFLMAKELDFEKILSKETKKMQVDLEGISTTNLALENEFYCYSSKLSHVYEALNAKTCAAIAYFKKTERNRMLICINGASILFLINILNRPFIDVDQEQFLSKDSYQIFQRGQMIASDLSSYLK